MRALSTELKVGFFAVFVLLILAFMTFKVGGLDWFKKKGYTVYVSFRDIAGLDEKTKVKVAGVDAGVIEKIQLRDGIAILTLRIRMDVPIYSDAVASIKAAGLLGDKYLEINTGSQPPQLKNGDTIGHVIELVDVDDMMRRLAKVSDNISSLASSLNEAFGSEQSKAALKETVLNLGDITSNLNRTIVANDKKMRNVLDNIKNLTASLSDFVDTNKEPLTATISNMRDLSGRIKGDAPELIANLNKAAKDLKDLVDENKSAVSSTMQSVSHIAERIDKGEGTLGKLVKDDKLYNSINNVAEGLDKTLGAIDRFKTFITFQADYLTASREGKGYFYVTLQPKPDKYYILGIVRDPLGKVSKKRTETTSGAGRTVVEKEVTEKEIEFTAQIAKRFTESEMFKDTAVRAGITESTFGIGADYFFNKDKGRGSVDIWDFSNDEEDSGKPHVRVGVDYYLFKNLFVTAGGDNLLNKKRRGGYAGVGVRFQDEDLKYLLGSLPRVR
ncbi:MAG TPA: MlaD family protein [Thermodesulfovibrionales bacterium]|nr:MlaD family protein [Thermodesulfovibrionales bacterium]